MIKNTSLKIDRQVAWNGTPTISFKLQYKRIKKGIKKPF